MQGGAIAAIALLTSMLWACGAATPPATQPTSAAAESARSTADTVQRAATAADAVEELARRIPAGALRCVASTTVPLSPEQRALTLLVSQTETLPWTVELPVVAYARARMRTVHGYLTVSWLHFDPSVGGPERIRAALRSAAGARLRWEQEEAYCRDTTECSDTVASFVAPHVVRLVHGRGEPPSGAADNPCAALRREFPGALEVASWGHDTSFAVEAGLERTDQVLVPLEAGLTKLRRRHFSDDRDQIEAYRDASFGADELPMIAGLPVEPYRKLDGLTLTEESDVQWEDLRMVVEDQRRERQWRDHRRSTQPGSAASLDELREQAQLMLAALSGKPKAQRRDAARLLSTWLLSVRRKHARDEVLASVQYRVFIDELADATSALAVANEMLRLGGGDTQEWKLHRRRALSHQSAEQLSEALVEAHGLSPAEGLRMARELTQAVRAGARFERVEWAWLTARSLAERARKGPRVAVDPLALPLMQLPRALAYLAARSPALRGTYGVHVMASGSVSPRALAANVDTWAAVSSGGGEPALVGAASSVDDKQLRELGELLVGQLEPGPVRLRVGVRSISDHADGGGIVLVFEGELRDGQLTVARMDARASTLDWSRLQRFLLEPLQQLRGRAFPPDELRLPASDAAAAAEMVAWGESEADVECRHVERWVVCRGPMHDPGAALRTLLRIGDRVLADQSHALWLAADR